MMNFLKNCKSEKGNRFTHCWDEEGDWHYGDIIKGYKKHGDGSVETIYDSDPYKGWIKLTCCYCGQTKRRYDLTGQGNAACFIATACYGSSLAPELDVLRSFRDRCLPDLFVRFYYFTSPPIADFIKTRNYLKIYIRTVLDPIVKFLKKGERT